jgi:hypothetical protein
MVDKKFVLLENLLKGDRFAANPVLPDQSKNGLRSPTRFAVVCDRASPVAAIAKPG